MTNSKNILIILGAVVFVVLIAVLLYVGNSSKTNFTQQSSPNPMYETSKAKEPNKEMTIVLKSQNNSLQTGSANLKEENGKVLVTVNIKKGPADIPQPSHIHTGTCENLGAIKFPLSNVINGFSQKEIETTLGELKASMPLAVNVHKSNEEAKIYVACGNLEFTSPDSEATPSLDQP